MLPLRDRHLHQIASVHGSTHASRLALRASLEPLNDVSLSLATGIGAAQLALPALGGAVLT